MSEEVVLLVAIGEPRVANKSLSTKTASAGKPVRGESFAGAIESDGGVEPFTYALTGGTLPPGIALDAGTGGFSGTPTTQGHYEFEVEVTDAEANAFQIVYSMSVEGGLVWETKSLPDAEHNVRYSAQLKVSGGTPPYTFGIQSGAFPFSLVLSGPGAGQIVSASPFAGVVPARSQFTLRATDAVGNYADKTFSVILWPSLQWEGPSQSDGLVGLPFEQRLGHRYGMLRLFEAEQPTPTFSIDSGTLPQGLAISPTTGTIYGTPRESGLFNYQVRMTDSLGGTIVVPMQSRIAAVTDIDQIYETVFGDGGSNEFLIVHGLGAFPRSVVVYETSASPPWPTIDVEWSVVDADTISVTTANVPTAFQYTIIVTG